MLSVGGSWLVRLGFARDQSCSAAVGGEAEYPASQYEQPIFEADQVEQVHGQPSDPGDEAAEVDPRWVPDGRPDPLEVGDRTGATDCREVALVEVGEPTSRAAFQAVL